MGSASLQEKIISNFGGVNDGVSAKFRVNDADFVFTDGVIYQSIDGELCGGFKKVKTLKAVSAFVEVRA